ncbi:hypothetical protein VL20_859 [Microcystis panniformis FACHB-1757]|uniref:Uncharacterized protein n=1 Tax=Microcystis panniformis FACHB-1757 TaxID=1638788 RepID=A0A0K1RWA4_9CHRO|nr:hypothetical protein VL20_859 [Microcystis panniformis FACHB-1757]
MAIFPIFELSKINYATSPLLIQLESSLNSDRIVPIITIIK